MKLRNGLSLVELTIAFFILGLILVPIFQSFLQTTGIIKIGQHDLEVLNLGASFAAQIRKMDITVLPPTTGEVPLQNPTAGSITIGSGARIEMPKWDSKLFSLTYETKNFSLPPCQDGALREGRMVTLKIYWKERMGNDKILAFPVLLING